MKNNIDINTKKILADIILSRKDIIIIDTFNYLFKYAYTMGTNNNAYIKGVDKLIKNIKRNIKGCSLILAVDGNCKFRKELNSEYKSNRKEPPFIPSEGVRDWAKECVKHSYTYLAYDKDWEADDTIWSIVQTIYFLCNKNKIRKNVYILSTDKDMYQMIKTSEYVKIKIIKKFVPKIDKVFESSWKSNSEIISEKDVPKVFNSVKTENLLIFRALTGDKSDNLKGYHKLYKKHASDIANNCIYDIENKKLKLKNKDTLLTESKSYDILDNINNEIELFDLNYKIMKMYFYYPKIQTPENFLQEYN